MRSVAAGNVLAGKFRIEGVIGVGGMGLVVAAHHLALDQRVALKLMLPELLAARPDLAQRFLREARTAARLRSEHVTRVFDVGTLDDGAPYIVMELLEGMDLATCLRRSGPLSVSTVAALVQQATSAVAEAHSLGIVHRDLKPANLFLTRRRDGSLLLKVLDLGICKLAGGDAERTTHPSEVIGTPAYMAPEQRRDASTADARADVWSLGIILYELISGRLPELATGCPALAATDVPPGFDDVIARCLAPVPADRFAGAAELGAALASYAGEIDLPDALLDGPATVEPTAAVSAPPAPTTRWRPRTRLAALGAVLVCAAIGLSFAMAGAPPGAHRPPAPPAAPVAIEMADAAPSPVIPVPASPVAAPAAAPIVHPRAAPRRRRSAPPPADAPPAAAPTPRYDPLADPD